MGNELAPVPIRGELFTLWLATCGLCTDENGYQNEPARISDTAIVNTHKQAVAYLRERGWHNTRRHGWVCPDCWNAKTAKRRGRRRAVATRRA